MKHRGELEGVEGRIGQPERFAELEGVHGHLVGVPTGVVVPGPHDVHQPACDPVQAYGFHRRRRRRSGLGHGIAAPLLGCVQAGVCDPHQAGEGIGVVGIGGDAQAEPEGYLPAFVGDERLGTEGLTETLGHLHGSVPVGVGKYEHHLVAAHAARQVGVPQNGTDGVAHLAQHPVAGGVPVGVVEELEVVEVDHHEGEFAAALLGPPPFYGEALMDPPMVVQAGERVSLGQPEHLFVTAGVIDGGGQLSSHRLDEVWSFVVDGRLEQPQRADLLPAGFQDHRLEALSLLG